MSKIEGRVRESADGLRGRKSAEQTREAQKGVAREAASQRADKEAGDSGEEQHGHRDG